MGLMARALASARGTSGSLLQRARELREKAGLSIDDELTGTGQKKKYFG